MKYKLILNAEISQEPYNMGYGLRVNESLELEAHDFMQLCEILAEFHKLAEHLKKHPKP